MSQDESGILEASPGAIALLIVFFLVVTLGIDHGLHHLKHYLKRRNKHGLLAAVTNLSNELMLLGVASLLLTAIEPAVTKVCLPAKSQMKPWLSNVQGCACCLTRTEGVSHCFIEDRHCPADFKQQCGAHSGPHRPLSMIKHTKYAAPDNGTSTNSTTADTHSSPAAATHTIAPASPPAGKRLLAAPPTAAEAALPPVPAEPAANSRSNGSQEPVYMYQDYGEPTCAGPVEEAYEECDYRPGYAPVITGATLEQVHMLLFIMAVVHILLSVVVLILSMLRLRHWAKINGGPSDDALALAALQLTAASPSAASISHIHEQPGASMTGSVRAGRIPSKDVAALAELEPEVVVVADDGVHKSVTKEHLNVPKWNGRALHIQGPVAWLGECWVNTVRQLLLGLMSVVTKQEYSLLRATFYYNHKVHLLASDVASPQDAATDKLASDAAVANDRLVQNSGHCILAKNVELSSAVSDTKIQQQLEQQVQQQQQDTSPDQCSSQMVDLTVAQHQQQQQRQGSVSDSTRSSPTASSSSSPASSAAATNDAGTIKAVRPAAQPQPAAPAANSAAAGVGLYAPYLLESVERDGSKVVGLGLPMWLLVIAFVLLSGAIGWATWLLLIIAGALLLVINTSLIAALRHVTRGGVVRTHNHNSWWLRHSRPLLAAVKLMLFFLSFVISNAVYFAAFFGPDSCFFSRTGFQRNPVPWYAVMIIDLGLLLSLALVTLPLYTLLTHTLRADKKLMAEMLQRREQHGGSHHGTKPSH